MASECLKAFESPAGANFSRPFKETPMFAKFIRDESGATAIEYGLIASLIAVAIIAAVELVGTNLTTTFNTVAAKI
jgi:pilus assembly protein Flp/PilA